MRQILFISYRIIINYKRILIFLNKEDILDIKKTIIPIYHKSIIYFVVRVIKTKEMKIAATNTYESSKNTLTIPN